MDASTAAAPYGFSPQYATPGGPYPSATPRPATRVWAGAVVLAAALGLVFLAGCFLIGVMLMVSGNIFDPNPVPVALTPAAISLLVTLYAMTFTCLAGAAYLIVSGARALSLAIRG